MIDIASLTQLAPDLDERACRLLIGWDELERRNGRRPVIDFNVSGASDGDRFEHRLDVLDAFTDLLRECDPESFAHERLTAHETYLRTLMGQAIPFDELVAATQGVEASMIPDATLRVFRCALEEELAGLGIDAGEPIDDQLEQLDPPLSFDDVEPTFRSLLDEHRHSLEAVVERPLGFELDIVPVEVDEYWSYWVDGIGNRFRLRLNQRRASFSHAECVQFTFHELLAHCGQMEAWARHIEAGELARYFGITTVHTPEQVMLEGLAQTLPLLIPNDAVNSSILAARIRLMRYALMLKNNLHCMINRGAAIQRCVSYNRRWSLSHDARRVADDLASRSTDPLYRSYQYVYPAGCDLFFMAHKHLTPADQACLVRTCFRGPASAGDIAAAIEQRR